ncbi:hypothetical protein OHB35_01455 [Streptomyces phaeochromogenes]|uniref:Uncharacterized protein n=1 Tax=Streptomyces phaeochromogenes TaxID=1923 RepID=A0ABZ1H376_STRPH|nr:hypothetical protein [Streptomyces phaeochromogenes]WSD11981.1 hypothetical protein OHB35_01455 [Streptomyces phaeochromogenes]
MGIDYDPTRRIVEVDTDKIAMARNFVRTMRGTPGIGHASEAQTLLELAEALEGADRVEEGSKVRERAQPLIVDALAPVYRTVAETERSGDP